ncbi:MAG: antibiotic biosynthesis monooxygenase [Candidatus Thiodiazotropha sp.]
MRSIEVLNMSVIVAGKLILQSNTRERFLEASRETVIMARNREDCDDFSVSADLLEMDRVNIFEKWKHRAALEGFRNSGSRPELFSLVTRFQVSEYEVPD